MEAAASFDRIRPEILRLCAEDIAGPPRTYRIHVTFDAEGREVLRSVVPESKGSQLAPNCLARQLPGSLRIPPQGGNVSTIVRVTIP